MYSPVVYATGETAPAIHTKTHPEITAVAETDGSLLVVPVGSTEQHGHHLPVGTDSMLAHTVALDGAARVIETMPVLVTPPVWFGYSPEHLAFGGTLTDSFRSFHDTLENIATVAEQLQFDAVVFCNGHGGNIPPLQAAVSTAGRDAAVTVVGLTYFTLGADVVADVRESDLGGMFHGGELETSLMQYLFPELVRDGEMSRSVAAAPFSDDPADITTEGSISTYRSFDELSASGVIGDPESASAEKGGVLHEAFVDEFGTLLTDIHASLL